MGRENEYLVNLDVKIIKASMGAAGVVSSFIDSRVIFKEVGFLDKCLEEKKMPKTQYMMLCNFFQVIYPTFSTDGKYVFAKDHTSNKGEVEHKLTTKKIDVIQYHDNSKPARPGRKKNSENVIEFDKDELNNKLNNSTTRRTEFAIRMGKSQGYINTCMQTGRMDKTFYEALIQELERTKVENSTDVKPTAKPKVARPKVVKPADITDYASYKTKMKDLIKKTGKMSKDIAVECGMGATYISYCFSNEKYLNSKVEEYISNLAGEDQPTNDTSEASRMTLESDKNGTNNTLNMSPESDNISTSEPKMSSKSDSLDSNPTNEMSLKSNNNLQESAKTIIPIFNEIVPNKIDLVTVEINKKKYVLIEKDIINRLVDSLKMSTEILEYISRETQ